jgi:ABC-type multidrug transport system ATPase subunit
MTDVAVTARPTDTADQAGATLEAVPAESPICRLHVCGLEQQVAGERCLCDIGFAVAASEVVAIVGGSGAGKTTLLETVLGIRVPTAGTVTIDGVDRTGVGPSAKRVGYVPQDDIVHLELPLGRTLRHAARLRLRAGTASDDLDTVVADVVDRLGLAGREHVAVGDLSGGERKRASIAVELLDRPSLLDEPTSGLDPAAAADLLDHLRHLADEGAAIVLTTHSPDDVERCDRLLFLARGGRLVFDGSPAEARRHFAVDHLAEVYQVVLGQEASEPIDPLRPLGAPDRARPRRRRKGSASASLRVHVHQWWVLTRRSAELLLRNRLTLAVLLGSPIAVTVMMAVMFRPGALEPGAAELQSAVQTVYWLAFAAFFFGLTYGLLQIVTELAVVRRDRLAGMGAGAYVAAKVTVLTPLLALVSAAMLAVLRALDRLPSATLGRWLELELTLVLTALAALAVGLLASAAVTDATQATLALPMICFPQVLFAGALVPTSQMAAMGRWMSVGLADRWSFEALGRVVEVDRILGDNALPVDYRSALIGSPVSAWLALVTLTIIGLVLAVVVLARRTP